TMAGVDNNTLTMEQYLALSRENQAPGVVKPEIGGNVNFEIKRPIPGMTPTQALTAIQTMADHSLKWHDGTSSRNISNNNNTDVLAAVIRSHLDKECPLNEEVKQVEEVKYGEFGRPAPFNGSNGTKFRVKTLTADVETKVEKLEGCKTIFANDGTPLYTPFYYSPKEIEYFSTNSGFSNDEKSKSTELKTSKVIPKLKSNLPEQMLKENQDYLAPPQGNQTNGYYPKYMKDLVDNKQLTEKDDEVRMNPRCLTLLQNQLPPKENDPGSFILPCSIGRLDFNNALADLGASISIMHFSMFKRLGIGKLKPIDMVIEMTNDTKCIPKGIVKNLLIKIDKFILPVDFVILDTLLQKKP
ncbi:hypothetical protein Tco_1281525, partial [Tanacetum coccineum]